MAEKWEHSFLVKPPIHRYLSSKGSVRKRLKTARKRFQNHPKWGDLDNIQVSLNHENEHKSSAHPTLLDFLGIICQTKVSDKRLRLSRNRLRLSRNRSQVIMDFKETTSNKSYGCIENNLHWYNPSPLTSNLW